MRKRSVLAFAFAVLGVAAIAQESDPGPRAECTFNPETVRSPRDVYRQLSRQAEAVATSRRRSSPQRPSPPSSVTPRNFIDTEIFGKMTKDGIRWTSRSGDEEFLRRVTLDLTGQIPTAEKVKQFTADTSPNKRDRLIDELLASEGYVDRWTLWFGDHVQMTQRAENFSMGLTGRNAYYNWIVDSFRTDKPYDQMVREVVSARGSQFTVGPVNYWVRQVQTNGPAQDTFDNLASRSAERFLGIPLECLSCHSGIGHLEAVNSSLVRRTRTEFWKQAAFFASDTLRTQRLANNQAEYFVEPNPNPLRAKYFLNTNSGNKTPRQAYTEGTTQVTAADPAFFLSGEKPAEGEAPREAYGRILTKHPQFARATVNYIWKEIFAIGLVEPAESFDLLRQDPATLPPGATLQPTHPALLTQLADSFAASGYSIKALLRTIVQSEAYQLSSYYTPGEWNELWTPYYARHYPRRILAESVVDAVTRATGVAAPTAVTGLAITRAMQLPDPTERPPAFRSFIDAFGRGDRDSSPRTNEGSIVQALAMLNDSFIVGRVSNRNNSTVARILASTKDPGTIADELYIATLSRRPTPQERSDAIAQLQSGDLARKTEDLQFALLNRLQFLYN